MVSYDVYDLPGQIERRVTGQRNAAFPEMLDDVIVALTTAAHDAAANHLPLLTANSSVSRDSRYPL